MSQAARIYAAAYAPTMAELQAQLPGVAVAMRGRLLDQSVVPTLAGLDTLIRDSSGLIALLMKLRQVLESEAAGGTPSA